MKKYDPKSERSCFRHVTWFVWQNMWGNVFGSFYFTVYWRGRFTHGIKIMDDLCNYYKLWKAPEWSSSRVNRAKSLQYLVFKPGLSERCSNGKWTDNKHITSECLQLLCFQFQHTKENFLEILDLYGWKKGVIDTIHSCFIWIELLNDILISILLDVICISENETNWLNLQLHGCDFYICFIIISKCGIKCIY